jgi:arsenate reductase
MDTKKVLSALGALAQESRLAVFRLLVQAGPEGMAATKISEHLGVPSSSLSFHLKEMAHADLVTSRQESRFVIYSANFKTMTGLVHFLTENCCDGTPCVPVYIPAGPLNVLFLCTGNSARSIMAEAMLNTLGRGQFRAYSAGSHPIGAINPFAYEQIKNLKYPLGDLRSKRWDEFAVPGAPHMDFIITLCDDAAGEDCPRWPGHPVTAHWGFQDPAAFEGTDAEKQRVFAKVSREIKNRLDIFSILPFEKLSRIAIKQELDQIGAPRVPSPLPQQATITTKNTRRADKVHTVLFLCTGNSARSIMAEALVTILGKGRFKGFSAGSKPGGKVNPFAIEQIKNFDPAYPTSEMRSKSWDEFARPDAPHMDFIITVCDNAAAETCPYWPGHPATAHWGFEDPAAVKGSDEAKRAAFKQIFNEITHRVRAFVALPMASMDDDAIRQATQKIGGISV